MSLAAAALLNEQCWCIGTDLPGLHDALDTLLARASVAEPIRSSHPHLFAGVPLFIADSQRQRIADVVAAIQRVVALPGWQAAAVADAPAIAAHAPGNAGAFLGVDFHLQLLDGASDPAPQLIEINTNPGGALLNVLLGRAQQACCAPVAEAFPDLQNFDAAEARLAELFLAEWRAAGRVGQPRHLVVCDEAPQAQYLYPEFLLYRELLGRAGVRVSVADPRTLQWQGGQLLHEGAVVDMVYNRLTDFALAADHLAPLRAAWLADAIVLTPHPRSHALFASKRNLVHLSDAAWLAGIGVDAATSALLASAVPPTRLVRRDDADALWAERRRLFFKPLDGFGSRGAYRGDKLTRGTFESILDGGYVAQRIVPPTERVIAQGAADGRAWGEGDTALKVDLRAYSYDGEVLLLAARLYRGQTTNFRTEGGGFAPVLRAAEGCGRTGTA